MNCIVAAIVKLREDLAVQITVLSKEVSLQMMRTFPKFNTLTQNLRCANKQTIVFKNNTIFLKPFIFISQKC